MQQSDNRTTTQKHRIKKGRSITVPAGAEIWLPDGYKACEVMVRTPPGEPVKHGMAPENERK